MQYYTPSKRPYHKAGHVLGILSLCIPPAGTILGLIGLPMAIISKRKSSIIMCSIGIILWVAVYGSIFLFVPRPVHHDMHGNAMFPTFSHGETLVVQATAGAEYMNGDIIVFNANANVKFQNEAIVQRIIASAGQSIRIYYGNHHVYVDGVLLSENYIWASEIRELENENFFYTTVAENHFFVMPDNRNYMHSKSNGVGTMHESQIVGRVILVAGRVISH